MVNIGVINTPFQLIAHLYYSNKPEASEIFQWHIQFDNQRFGLSQAFLTNCDHQIIKKQKVHSQFISSMKMDHVQERGIKAILLYSVGGYLWHVDSHLFCCLPRSQSVVRLVAYCGILDIFLEMHWVPPFRMCDHRFYI